MRVHFKGEGFPIPTVALPDPNVDTNFPPQTFLFEEDGTFHKADYVSLGYTHYEAWCIGAAGGRGGGKASQAQFATTQVRPAMSGSDWELYLEMQAIYASQLAPPFGPYGGTEAGMREYYESQFPNHDPFFVTTYQDPFLIENPSAKGGGGGGGGLHVVSGELADLPDISAVVVGQAGQDAGLGQDQVNGLWTPIPQAFDLLWPTEETRLKQLENYFTNYKNKYPLPHPGFLPPVSGADGGTSSFNGDLARASGGKGGDPAVSWPGGVKTHNALGREGGAGDRDAAGGGGAGSAASGVPGVDGTWDGTIGKGGGGGIGGTTVAPAKTASHGGRGSYSFADTSVHGPRQSRVGLVPGGGGGATLEGSSHYGSKALKAKPNGVVFVRLVKVG